MSTDPFGAKIGRSDAAVDGSLPPTVAGSPRGLDDLAAAIEHIAVLIARDATPEPDASAALERIADIAFVLHERDVEASLCDALDAAVREASQAAMLREARGQRLREAAELLRALSRRINDMVALSQPEQRAVPPAAANTAAASPAEGASIAQRDGEEAADNEIRRDRSRTPDVEEDDEFARAVASLTASLADSSEPRAAPEEASVDVAQPADQAQNIEPPAQGAGDAIVAVGETEPLAQGADDAIVTAGEAEPPEEEVGDVIGAVIEAESPAQGAGDAIVTAIETDPPVQGADGAIAVAGEPEPPAQSAGDAIIPAGETEPPPAAAAEEETRPTPEVAESPRAPSPESQPLVGPDEDPGDLFEPVADAGLAAPSGSLVVASASPNGLAAHREQIIAPNGGSAGESAKDAPASARGSDVDGLTEGAAAAATALALPPAAEQNAKPAAVPAAPSPPPISAAASAHITSRPPPNDPLAPVLALSEEETIALFS
jgi:hypothetical protein